MGMYALASRQPLALGHQRAVYAHPEDPGLLIKVMRPEAVAKRWNAPGRWLKRLPRARQYVGYLRELKETLAAQARHAAAPPLARALGLVDTDLGLGLVCECIRGADGDLAPTLHAQYVAHGGPPPWAAAALATLQDELLRDNVIVGDLNASNIVCGRDATGAPRLLLVDGFGEKAAIPLASLHPAINRYFIRRRFRRMCVSWRPPCRAGRARASRCDVA